MSAMTFSDDMARIQRAVAQCRDLVLRYSQVLEALQLRRGERVLEIGCGGGFLTSEVAKCVGPTGAVRAIDISADQIAAAQNRCAEISWATCEVADALSLPYEDETFDLVYSHQVFEYVTPLATALREVHRVLRPGGRCAIVATDWNTAVWHSAHPDRMQRVLTAWAAHSPTPHLPSILGAQLRQAGLEPLRQIPLPMINRSYHGHSFSYWVARLIQAFVVGRQIITGAEAEAWLQEFDELEQQGAYFFCSMPILTEAVKVA
jgi:ubiquinone/menaquinone biosynthesis C-methylase UbiE